MKRPQCYVVVTDGHIGRTWMRKIHAQKEARRTGGEVFPIYSGADSRALIERYGTMREPKVA